MRQRVHEVLEVARTGDRVSQAMDGALLCLIVSNVAALVVSTDKRIYDAAPQFFIWFEIVSFGIFTVEYALRVWACASDPKYSHPVKGRLRYMLKPIMVADAASLLSFFFIVVVIPDGGLNLVVLRALRLVGRLAALGRYSPGMGALAQALAARKNEMLAVVSVLAALMVFASSLMFFVEHTAQPDKFSSIPAAMWWSIITVTTVGYGDVAPVTSLGRLLAGAIALLGIGIFALPAGILGSSFMEQVNRRSSESAITTCPHCGRDIHEPPAVDP